jgi:cytochrome c556
MAENTTTYTAVIDTQVNGGEEVKGLGDEAQETGGKFKALRSQIRETNVALQKLADEGKQGTAEFETLRAKLDELNDAQEKVNFQAGQFDDQLAALPGPLGQLGGGIQSFNAGLNKFSTGFKVALGAIGLIIGAIAAFRESLSRTEEGQAKLNKITEAFEKIMNGLFAVIEPVAMMFADLLVGLLENEKVMKTLSVTMGILSGTFTAVLGVGKELAGFVINNLVNAFKTLVGVAGGAGKVLKGVFTFDLELIKEGVSQVGETVKTGVTSFVDNVKNTAKGIGTAVVNGVKTGFEAGSKSFTEGSKRLTEAEKKAAEEAKKKREENAAKRKEEDKKLAEQRKKDIEAAGKIETEAYLSTLEARDKEIFKRGEKLNTDLEVLEKGRQAKIAEARKNGNLDLAKIDSDFNASRLAVQNAYNLDVTAINTKYDEEQKKKDEEKKQKALETAKLLYDEAVLANENRSQLIEQRYNREIALVNEKEKMMLSAEGLSEEQKKTIRETAANERLNAQAARYDELVAVVDEKEKIALSNTELTEAQRTKIVLDATKERQSIEQTRRDDEILGIDNELANIATTFDRKRELIAQKEAELLAQEGLTQNQRTQIAQTAANERQAIDMAELQAKADLQNAYLDLASGFGSFLKEIAGKNKKIAIAGVIVEQAAAIGKIVVNTGIANAKALAASPLTFGQPWIAINTISAGLSIASSVAAGLKAIQQINSAESGSPATATTPPRTAGGAAPTPPSATTGPTAIPQIVGSAGQATPGQQIAQTLAARTDKPIKAYVVSGDVTSQQALDRRTTRAATFSGG